ncbi:MAG: hypothetical protein Q9221_004268 [Calogaya cf. arnoldii]
MIFNSRYNLLTILLLLISTSTISLILEIPPPTIAQAASKSPKLGGPPTPPGFTIRLLMSSSEPLIPDHIFLCAIEAMYHYAESDWDDVTRTGHSATIKGLQISYYDVPDRPINIEYKHIIIAVLMILDTMDRTNDFQRSVAELKHNGAVFGTLRLGKRSASELDGGDDGSGTNPLVPAPSPLIAKSDDSTAMINPTTSHHLKPNISTPLTTHSSLIDPSDPALNITYTYSGLRLNCRNLFSAALSALATLAHDDVDGRAIDLFTAVNWSHNVVFQTFSDESAYGDWLLTPDMIKRVARLLPARLWEEGGCGEVYFQVFWQGLRQGAGRFWVND